MSKKCFIVTAEIDLMVFAEDERSAREIGYRGLSDEIGNICDDDLAAQVATYLPAPWDTDRICHQDGDEDVTVGEALEQTPEFKAAQERLRKIINQSAEQT